MYLRKKIQLRYHIAFPFNYHPAIFSEEFKHNSVFSYNNITSHLYDENVT